MSVALHSVRICWVLFTLLIAVARSPAFAQDHSDRQDSSQVSSAQDSACRAGGRESGHPYSARLTATGGTPPYTWSLRRGVLPTGLALNSSTGVISGIPEEAVASDLLSFEVKDCSDPEQRRIITLSLTINAAATPVSITTTLPAATENAAYSQQLAATGGSGSYIWSLTTPVSGFSLSSSGLLTGTATSTTTLLFAVKATDSANSSNFGTATLKLTVNAAASPVSIATTPPAATENVAYSQQLAATGGSGSYI